MSSKDGMPRGLPVKRDRFAEVNASILDDGTAQRIEVDSWMSAEDAAEKYAQTWDWSLAQIRDQRAQLAGRSFHIGAGRFVTVCPDCNAETVTYGAMPVYYTIGPHMVSAHGAKVPGINVGILG